MVLDSREAQHTISRLARRLSIKTLAKVVWLINMAWFKKTMLCRSEIWYEVFSCVFMCLCLLIFMY